MAYRAALFDMDGTLLDSMGVWTRVDEDFFALRHMEIPADYGASLSGKSFYESALYTKQRFSLPESVEEIIDEWNALCRAEYAGHVKLKPGAKAYLRLLKRSGVKLAVATALPEHLFLPALRHNGVDDLFDAFASTEETQNSKQSGEVYALAAQRLGVAPEDCIVFEDILEGHLGARNVGMRSCNVYDKSADHNRAAIAAAADFCIRDFTDVSALPPVTPRWNRAVIAPAWAEGGLPTEEIRPDDCVIAADRGFVLCRQAGIEPDFCLGDFDSLRPGEVPPAGARVCAPEKDDTDAAMALKLALSLGLSDVVLLGGVGGRLDHTVANLQLMRYAHARDAHLTLAGRFDRAELLSPGAYALPADGPVRFSLFAFSPRVEALCIAGAKYPLSGAALTDAFPLGISNERLPGAAAEIRFTAGLLLLVISEDRPTA